VLTQMCVIGSSRRLRDSHTISPLLGLTWPKGCKLRATRLERMSGRIRICRYEVHCEGQHETDAWTI
jgi:hypothetical protein